MAGGVACALSVVPLTSCRPDPPSASATAEIDSEPEPTPPTIDFPTDLYTPDDAVNATVDALLSALAARDYARVRALWTLTEDPPKTNDLSNQWSGPSSISLLALQPVRTLRSEHAGVEDAEPGYVLMLEAEREAESGETLENDNNQAILLLVFESDQWRLSRTPKVIRQWLLKSVAGG